MRLSPEIREQDKKAFEDQDYCVDWGKTRRWLKANDVVISEMPEEIKFQELLKENKYVERARGIQVILAA